MNMEFKHFVLKEEDGIAFFTMNRPEALNALNLDAWDDLLKFADYLEKADNIRAAIITGEGNKAFIAGADISTLFTMNALSHIFDRRLSNAITLLENGSKPVIAAINGFALGGGLELALGCDIRIVSENAILGLPETGLGIIPGAGGTQRLARLVGIGVAKEIIMGGRKLNAQEAVNYGLAIKVVPQDELLNEAVKIAKGMMAKAPVALALAKKAINASLDTDLKNSLYIEGLSTAVLFSTEDMHEGTKAFIEKRKPDFKGK